MAIDVSEFDTIDDLEVHFKKAFRKAPDEEAEAVIKAEQADAKVAWYRHQSEKSALQLAKLSALDKYPLAKGFEEDVRGSTPQEVEASAKRFHEKVEKMQGEQAAAKQTAAADEAAARVAAQQQYGTPASAGTGTPIPPALEDGEVIKQRVRGRLSKGMGMQDSQSKLDLPRFSTIRLREAVDAAQGPNARYKNPGNSKRVEDDRR